MTRKLTRRGLVKTAIAWIPLSVALTNVAWGSAPEPIEQTQVKGGLVVHVGCGNGELTGELRVNDSYSSSKFG